MSNKRTLKPLVSVVITTYNRPETLCRAIDSVLQQQYENIEIIVVDDFSDDETTYWIKEYSNRVKYIRNSANLGLSASRNVGIKSSAGEYISFLDDDDILLPDKIAKQVEVFITRPDVDVLYCGSLKKYRNQVVENLPAAKGCIYPEVLNSTPNAIHTLLVSRYCFYEIGFFDEGLHHLEDFDFWIRLAKRYKFDYVPECLVVYNIHGNQMSTRRIEPILGRDKVLKKHLADFRAHKKYYLRHLRWQASKCAIIDDYRSFYKYLFLAIFVRPYLPTLYVHLFVSVLSRKLHKRLILTYGVKKVGDVLLF